MSVAMTMPALQRLLLLVRSFESPLPAPLATTLSNAFAANDVHADQLSELKRWSPSIIFTVFTDEAPWLHV